jgi:hypothetical protein
MQFQKSKPTLVEEAVPKTYVEPLASDLTMLAPKTAEPVVTMADLMLELEVVGEIFKKRRIYSVLSLKLESGRFTLTCSYKPEDQEMQRYISRFISGSLTPKGLAMVIAELKAGVGL